MDPRSNEARPPVVEIDEMSWQHGTRPGAAEAVPMLLFCPDCGMQHIDAKESPLWGHKRLLSEGSGNEPHLSHRCRGCGCIWRPADVATRGVQALQTRGEGDTWGGVSPSPSLGARLAALQARVETLVSALEAAHEGLKWYRDRYPAPVDGADDEMDAQIEDALGDGAPAAEGGHGSREKAGS